MYSCSRHILKSWYAWRLLWPSALLLTQLVCPFSDQNLSFPSLRYCCMFSAIPESVIKLSEKGMLGKVHFTQPMHYQDVRGPPFRPVSVLKSWVSQSKESNSGVACAISLGWKTLGKQRPVLSSDSEWESMDLQSNQPGQIALVIWFHRASISSSAVKIIPRTQARLTD